MELGFSVEIVEGVISNNSWLYEKNKFDAALVPKFSILNGIVESESTSKVLLIFSGMNLIVFIGVEGFWIWP